MKKITLLSIIVVVSLISINVYATNYQMSDVISNATFSINNTTITTNNKAWVGANSNTNFHLESDSLWSPLDNDIDYQYGYISFCASSDFNPTNFTPGNYSKNARLFNSYQKCQVANSNYIDAYKYYITWQINTTNVCSGVSNILCSLDNNFDFRVNKAMEYSLIDFGMSDKQIVVDTSSGMVIQQNQTIINNMSQINSSINQDHNYNNNPSETIQGQQDLDDFTEDEEDLINDLDFSGANQEVTIDTEASSYIWNIVNNLRSMSSYIVLIITSILGIGILKLVLNR